LALFSSVVASHFLGRFSIISTEGFWPSRSSDWFSMLLCINLGVKYHFKWQSPFLSGCL